MVPLSKAQSWCRNGKAVAIEHFETSAKINMNVEQAFQRIAHLALKQEQDDSNIYIPSTLDMNEVRGTPPPAACAAGADP